MISESPAKDVVPATENKVVEVAEEGLAVEVGEGGRWVLSTESHAEAMPAADSGAGAIDDPQSAVAMAIRDVRSEETRFPIDMFLIWAS